MTSAVAKIVQKKLEKAQDLLKQVVDHSQKKDFDVRIALSEVQEAIMVMSRHVDHDQ
jgi:hypothetical protein